MPEPDAESCSDVISVEEIETSRDAINPSPEALAPEQHIIRNDGRCEFRFSTWPRSWSPNSPYSSVSTKFQQQKLQDLEDDITDFIAYQVETNDNTFPFFCQDFYPPRNDHDWVNDYRQWTKGTNLYRGDPSPSSSNEQLQLRFKRYMHIKGIDFIPDTKGVFDFDMKSIPRGFIRHKFGKHDRPVLESTVACRSISESGSEGLALNGTFFATLWYGYSEHKVPHSVLPCGPLYRTAGELQLVQKRIEVFAAVEAGGRDWPHPNPPDWTIIASTPPDHGGTPPLGVNSFSLNGDLALVQVVQRLVLDMALREWDAVIDHIDGLLAEGHAICSPIAHDRLLVDDENLTRSRKYFWIMTSIDEFSVLIERTVQALEQLYTCYVLPKKGRNNTSNSGMGEYYFSEIDGTHVELVKIYKAKLHRLEDQRRRTELIRNGLFNASSVMESRLSSRLSENVRLLTYVSIFYIPLAFISSLWAVPNTNLRVGHLVYAMLVVGIVTYLVTFNINAISRVCRRVYQRKRDQIVELMNCRGTPENEVHNGPVAPWWDSKSQLPVASKTAKAPATGNSTADCDKWKDRAERYKNTFRALNDRSEPSEWYIVVFAIYHVANQLWSWAVAHLWPAALWQKLPTRRKPQPGDEVNKVEEGKITNEGRDVVMT